MKNDVKRLRNNKGLTQKQLAEALGVSRYTIIKIERGENTTDQIVVDIANYFNKDARYIFFGKIGAHNLQRKCDQGFAKEII